ncbi:MAG: hypothetical protein RI949_252 [Pseudomonadota bacterium]|jgi:hypothetical protein
MKNRDEGGPPGYPQVYGERAFGDLTGKSYIL